MNHGGISSMINKYQFEIDGQRDFYNDYLPLVDKNLTVDNIIIDNTDGVLNGNLLEFKLNINDLNTVLFQTIKYLSARRVKGKPIPANIILISLNDGKAYVYHSKDYLIDIEKIYNGGASKDNVGFIGHGPVKELSYVEDMNDTQELIQLLRSNTSTKIHIDENCIVGWANNYYSQYPNARKSDFIGDFTGKVKIIGEIRNPVKFKDFIYPYKQESNIKFDYLMDKLNDKLQKKNLGAFYTPFEYATKTLDLVREAIRRVPNGNDFIILDRCAGTGNLERFMTDEELSHTILSTYEYYEYKVLLELLGDKVRFIIPPTEKEDTFNMGLVRGSNALEEEYINNSVIKKYITDPKCTIILYENPPYAETTSIEHQKKKAAKKSSTWKDSYVVKEMKKEVSGAATNDLGNAFIWSAFKYYLRQPTDSYIVFSPVKYWKAQHLIRKRFIKGFAYNRRHFHTNIDACIMVALWSNEDIDKLNKIEIAAFNIIDNKLVEEAVLPIKKVKTSYSNKYFDKRKHENDKYDGIITELNGKEKLNISKSCITPIYNKNIIGYMAVYSSGFDNPDLHSSLLIAGRYDGHGFFLRSDNFLEKLPMFAASRYITYNRKWTERARIMKSADGSQRYLKDVRSGVLNQFLLKCLLFTSLETQNHMRSLNGSDGRFYSNQLCLDSTNGDTLATQYLQDLTINETEQKLLQQWEKILNTAYKAKNYNTEITYGIFQIIAELNTYTHDEVNKRKVWDYPELNGYILTLKQLIKDYYLKEIVPTLFEYEFLK